MKKGHIIFCFCLSLLMAFAFAMPVQAQQGQTVQGTVVDETGEPIIGAIIKVDGSKDGGTVTDVDGKFTIQAKAKDKLIASCIGFVKQTITDLKNPRIVLKEDNMKLDEVVVVGYGTQKMKNVTGAISVVTPEQISDLSVSQLGASLSGVVNGLSVTGGDSRPGSDVSLTVRQAGAVTSQTNINGYVPSTSPLYVIDDVISSEDDFNNLDVSMIQSISVLKDASAAVYGSRAAYGVVLVKTKRGQAGAPRISYSGQYGYADKISNVKMLSAYDYGVLWNGIKASGTSGDNTSLSPLKDLYQADELAVMKNLNYNLLDEYWKVASTQRHALNISGGSDKATYFAGISYVKQDGNIGRLDYSRWNYDVGTTININKWTTASLKVSGNYGEKNTAVNKAGGSNSDTDYEYLLTHLRYIPDYINGMPVAAMGTGNGIPASYQLYNFKAVQDLDNNNQTNPNSFGLNGSVEVDFGWLKPLKGLKMKVTYGKSYNNSKTNTLATYLNVYQMINRGGSGAHLYTGDGVDTSLSNFIARSVSNGNYEGRSMSTNDSYQLNYYLTYARTFGKHDVSGLFTIEKSESESEDLYGQVTNPMSFANGQYNTANGTQTTTFTRQESGSLSYVGRFNYAYESKYLAEFLIRSDASTKFAPENYWGVFPSLSLGWVMSEESWFKNHVKWTDYFKIRGSVGLLGQDNTKPWGWLQTYSVIANKGAVFGTNPSNNIGLGINSSDAPNRDAHWDTSYKTNLGIDTRLIHDKLAVTLDGYYNFNRNLFMSRSGAANFPATVGTKPSAENFGAIDDYGVELSLGWNDKIGKDIKYFVRLNTGYSDNKVLKEYWPSLIPLDQQHPNQRTDLGDWGMDCMGMFRSYQDIEEYFAKYNISTYMGLTKEAVRPGMLIYRDVRGKQNSDGTYGAPDGIVDPTTDMVHLSNRNNPYGFTTNFGFSWKGLEFKGQFSASWGGYSFVPTYARKGLEDISYTSMPSFWANNMFVYQDVYDAGGNVVAPKNINAKYPNLRYATVNSYDSNFWRVSGTRVTLRNITMAYSLPAKYVRKLGLDNLRVNMTAQNVLSLYNPFPDHFIDPMSGSYGDYPSLRTVTVGVNVSF